MDQNFGNRGGPQGFQPEDLQQLVRSLRRQAPLLFGAVLAVVGLMLALSAFYTVQPSEEVVITRLGKYDRTSPPGLHFKWPLAETATVVKSKLVLQEEFGFRTEGVNSRGSTSYQDRPFYKESQMLTGDLNVADVEWIVHYQIADPKKYLFHAQDPHQNIRDISEAIMRRVVGDRTVNEVLTTGRAAIGVEAQRLTQDILDKYDLGVRVVTVKLQDANPPEMVKASFNDVNAAKQEQEQAINNAEEAYNKLIPEARGKAEETISQAEGYASALVNHARGDTERFALSLKQYQLAPDITRKRLYLEAMEELYSKFGNLTIVDSNVKGVLPLFGQIAPTEKAQ